MDEESVSLSEYRGRPVVLVTLAVHCRHSYDTLPIIESLKREYEPRVAVLPVYVNVTAEDVLASTESLGLDFPLLVSPGRTLAEQLGSHPSQARRLQVGRPAGRGSRRPDGPMKPLVA